MELSARRARQALATLLVGLLPGAIYFWGELYLSGYTRNADGSRDVGHMEKLLGGGSIIAFVLLFGIPAIGAGLVSLAVARAMGRVTALRLTAIAAVLGALIPLAFDALSARTGNFSLQQLAGPVVAGSVAAFVLSAVFSLVAGLPLRGSSAARLPTSNRSLADVVVLGVAAVVTIAVLTWLTSLFAWGMAHPCHSCG